MPVKNVNVKYTSMAGQWLCILFFATFSLFVSADQASPTDFVVYKNPQCGCCDKWVNHVRDAGYSLEVHQSSDMNKIKQQFGINASMQSCHTAVHRETGLVFEGHIPVTHVTSLIESPVEGAVGLSVPGMPLGSPGMEVGARKDPYRVYLLKEEGKADTYATENMPQ